MFFVSDYFQSIDHDEDYSIIWHSVFGRPTLVAKEVAKTLDNGRLRGAFEEEALVREGYMENDVSELVEMLMEAHILIDSCDTEACDVGQIVSKHNVLNRSKVQYLPLIMCEECNFRCKYCIHFANARHDLPSGKIMPFDLAKASVDGYFRHIASTHLEEAYINFGGGEPLLNWHTVERLLPYIRGKSRQINIPVKMGINTNLSLLTPDIAKKLIQYDVEIAASLDGLKDGNDSVRLSKNLSGTYEDILRGFGIMSELGRPLNGFAMTVTEENFSSIDKPIIDWASSLGMDEVRIDIDVVGMVDVPVQEIVSKLMSVRRYAKSKGISVIGFWSRPAENLGLMPETDDIGFCGGERGNSLCVAPSGQVFPCGYSNYELGRYEDIPNIQSKDAYNKLLAKRDFCKLEECRGCPILGFCRGGCMITNEANGKPEKRLRMCELYVYTTYEILRESVEI